MLSVDILEGTPIEGWPVVCYVHLVVDGAVKALAIVGSCLLGPTLGALWKVTSCLWNLTHTRFQTTIAKLLWRSSHNLHSLLVVWLLQVDIGRVDWRHLLILLYHILWHISLKLLSSHANIPSVISQRAICVVVSVVIYLVHRWLLTPLQLVAFLGPPLAALVLKACLRDRIGLLLAIKELWVAV